MSQFRRRDRRNKTTRVAPKPVTPQNPQATSGLDPLEQRVLFTVLSAPTGLAGASNVAGEVFGSAGNTHRGIRRIPRESDSEGFIESKISMGLFCFLNPRVAPF